MHNVPIRVFIAAENCLLREALVRIFDGEKDVRVVGQAGHFLKAAEEMLTARTDVLLLNPGTPTLSNIEDLQKIRSGPRQVKIALFGMEEDEKVFFAAVRQGVVAYVLKDAHAQDVVAAVRALVRGEAVCPPRLCLWLFTYFAKQATWMPDLRLHVQLGLTRRERELLPMIAQGLTNKEIASQLNVSEQTVKNHVHRMIRKAGASRRLGVVERCGLRELVV